MLTISNNLPQYDTLDDLFVNPVNNPPPPYSPHPDPSFESIIETGPRRPFEDSTIIEPRPIQRRYYQQLSPPLISDFIPPCFQPSLEYRFAFKKHNDFEYFNIFESSNNNSILRTKFSHLSINLVHVRDMSEIGNIVPINHRNHSSGVLYHDIIISLPSYPNPVKAKAQLTSYQGKYCLTIEEDRQFVRYKLKKADLNYKIFKKAPLVPSNSIPPHNLRRSNSRFDQLIGTLNLGLESENSANLKFLKRETCLNTLLFIFASSYLLKDHQLRNSEN